MQNTQRTGHIAALITILVWGSTFISTKVLLEYFQPVEILFLRFVLGYLALWLIMPKHLRLADRKQELWFMAAGLTGVTLYYMLENIALTYTLASNVGVLVSISPLFTALLSRLLGKSEKLRPLFLAGLAAALAGVVLISYSGSAQLQLDPRGDVLAIIAAICWAFYSHITRHISSFGYPVIQTTRRTFFYGILFMVPALLAFGFQPQMAALAEPKCLLNLIYLGLGAGALCFVTWNVAVGHLGAVKTTAYLYLVPVVTLVMSALILGEPVTPASLAGMALTIAGLVLSEAGGHPKSTEQPEHADTK